MAIHIVTYEDTVDLAPQTSSQQRVAAFLITQKI